MSPNTYIDDKTPGETGDNHEFLPELEGQNNLSKRKTTELPSILTYDEIDRLLLSIDDLEVLVAVRLMLFGGLRVSEAEAVRVKDVYRAAPPYVFVHQGKGSKDRYAPIDVATAAIAHCYAAQSEKDPDDKLFSRSTRTLQRAIMKAYDIAGIKDRTTHSLRHTCATWQVDRGIDIETVRENLGHTDIATTQIYLHLNIRQRSILYRDATRFG